MLQGINAGRCNSSARSTRAKVALDESRTKSEDRPAVTGKKSRRLPKLFRIREKAHHPGQTQTRLAVTLGIESVAGKMSDTVHSLSTNGLTPKRQIQRWSDALTDLCGQFDVDALEGSSLEGRINFTTVSRLKLCQIEASQHRIAHTISRIKLSEHPYIKIVFQTHGVSHFEQDGLHFDIMPGDCFAYDVSCPHTIISPSLTRHEVVIVPKDLLKERGFQLSKMRRASSRRATAPAASPMISSMPRSARRRR